LILRALLDGASGPGGVECEDWDRLAQVAERNGVLLRLGEKVEAAGLTPGRGFAEALGRERRRAQALLDLIARVNDVCSANGMTFIFPKAFPHYPDMGRDVDLLLLPPFGTAGAALAKGLGVPPSTIRLHHRMARTATYAVAGIAFPVDVHYGRLGNLGEEFAYPRIIIENAGKVRINDVDFSTPAPEDLLLLQGMQKVYGRRYLRLSDLVCAMNIVRKDDLDWDYLIGSARRFGVFAGLCCYLSYVDQVYRGVCGAHLLRPELRRGLLGKEWGEICFRDGYYRYPNRAVAARLYLRKFAAVTARGNWESAGRLCLLPLAVLTSVLERLQSRLGRA
jgi:hypothetical protein